MTKKNEVLISGLPADKLLEASMQLFRDEHIPLQTSLMNCSPILNPAVGRQPTSLIFDLGGLKSQLDNVQAGLAGTIENLRTLWRGLEHHCRVAGKPPERTIESISAMTNKQIAEAAFLVTARHKEAIKLRKKVDEIESQQKFREQQKRLYCGAIKRARKDSLGVYQISEVDGMKVDENGIITELKMHVDEYLAECKKRKSGNRAA